MFLVQVVPVDFCELARIRFLWSTGGHDPQVSISASDSGCLVEVIRCIGSAASLQIVTDKVNDTEFWSVWTWEVKGI